MTTLSMPEVARRRPRHRTAAPSGLPETPVEPQSSSQDRFGSPRRWLIAISVVGALVAIGANCKYYFIAKRFGAVVPGTVYRSGQISKWKLDDVINEYGIAAIVDLQGVAPKDQHQRAEIELARQRDIPLYRFPLGGDGTGDVQNYVAAISVIHRCRERGEPVLVHCSAGSQRTGGIISCYELLFLKQSPQQVYQNLLDYRWDPEDDYELVDYVNANLATIAKLLVEQELLEEVPSPLPVLAP